MISDFNKSNKENIDYIYLLKGVYSWPVIKDYENEMKGNADTRLGSLLQNLLNEINLINIENMLYEFCIINDN